MPQNPKKTIRSLSNHIFRLNISNYLSSEQFALFCREQNIDDMWDGLLRLSNDSPDLYGNEVAKNAFSMLLEQIYQVRKDEFLGILAGLLADFSGAIQSPFIFRTIKEDLIELGYPEKDVEDKFLKTEK
jgi:hypothetical protein